MYHIYLTHVTLITNSVNCQGTTRLYYIRRFLKKMYALVETNNELNCYDLQNNSSLLANRLHLDLYIILILMLLKYTANDMMNKSPTLVLPAIIFL